MGGRQERDGRMLTVRPEQMEAFRRAAATRFAARMVAHLGATLPDEVRGLREQTVESLVSLGIEAAQGYGIRTADGVKRFLEATVRLGSGFDTDPARPELGAALRDPEIDGNAKLDRLEKLAGLDGSHRA